MADTLSPDLLARLDAIEDLPSLPAVLLRLLELCNGEDADVRPIARLIETDAALSAKILGVVNSLSHGLPNRVTGLEQAIVLLGTEAIKSIAVCASLDAVFTDTKQSGPSRALELRRAWRHSLECALVARSLARQQSYSNPDEVFLAGLLHDVGKLVLLTLFPEEYPQCLARSRANPDLLLAEEVRLGGLHADLGAWLVRRWRLPESIAEATESHHEQFHRVMDASLLVRFVYAANYLSSPASEREQFPQERMASLLGVQSPAVAEALARAARELEETARTVGLEIDPAEEPAAADERKARLTRELRSVSVLLASLWRLTRAPDEAGILEVLFRAMASLFHIDAALYFAYVAATDSLKCVGFSKRASPEATEGLVVNRSLSKSAVAEASRSGSPHYAFGQAASIIDSQMRRLMGVDGFICYPLAARGQTIGVLVVGGTNGKGEALRRKEKPLLLIAGEAALALLADRLRERELDRVRIERIAASQLVADRVVHEVRSPLAAIKNSVGALQGRAASPEAQTILASVSEEVDRIARLVAGLTRMSVPAAVELVEMDVSEVVASFLPVLERLIAGGKAAVTVATEHSLPRVRANADCLKQILVNLVRNAAEAMPEGGSITVRTERDPADAARTVRVVVEDDGPGVSERVLGRLFEPFVSTRGEGHRGLGLSIVLSLARQLGGDVRYERARAAGGARFVLVLPSV